MDAACLKENKEIWHREMAGAIAFTSQNYVAQVKYKVSNGVDLRFLLWVLNYPIIAHRLTHRHDNRNRGLWNSKYIDASLFLVDFWRSGYYFSGRLF